MVDKLVISYLRLYFHFSKIPHNNLIGKFLRLPFKLIPKSFKGKILQGYNKGYRWVLGSGITSYWLGHYEFFKQQLLVNYVKKGMVAYDLGGHVGFYTLLFSRLVGENGRVYVFEPNPRNLFYLQGHLKMNEIKNAVILPIGVAKGRNFLFFDDETNSSMGHFAERKSSLFVPVYDLDFLVSNNLIPPPNVIKIDVEGAEKEILLGARETIIRYNPLMQIALHIPEDKEFIFQFLKGLNYQIGPLANYTDEIVAKCI